jgi:hypothetical protein
VRRILKIYWIAFVVVAATNSACCTTRGIELVECVEPSEAAMARFEELPPEWQDWYLNDHDPLCEAIYNAGH